MICLIKIIDPYLYPATAATPEHFAKLVNETPIEVTRTLEQIITALQPLDPEVTEQCLETIYGAKKWKNHWENALVIREPNHQSKYDLPPPNVTNLGHWIRYIMESEVNRLFLRNEAAMYYSLEPLSEDQVAQFADNLSKDQIFEYVLNVWHPRI